jgi:hypothetical protein
VRVRERRGAGSDETLIAEIVAGSPVKEAAAKAKMSEATAHRRLGDPEFIERLAEARVRMLATAVHLAAEGVVDGVLTLRRLATSAETESVQLQAARSLVQHVPGLVGLVDLMPQFAEVRAAVEELQEALNVRRAA